MTLAYAFVWKHQTVNEKPLFFKYVWKNNQWVHDFADLNHLYDIDLVEQFINRKPEAVLEFDTRLEKDQIDRCPPRQTLYLLKFDNQPSESPMLAYTWDQFKVLEAQEFRVLPDCCNPPRMGIKIPNRNASARICGGRVCFVEQNDDTESIGPADSERSQDSDDQSDDDDDDDTESDDGSCPQVSVDVVG